LKIVSPENVIFTIIATSIRAQVKDVYVAGEYVSQPPKFPAVNIVESDNFPVRSTQTNANLEKTVQVVYEVNVYSNKTKGKKAECKDIAALIDTEFMRLGFTRLVLNPIQNMNDATIYRMYGRYRGEVAVDADGNYIVYRR